MLFTYTLLRTGHFYEANWIMRPIVSNPFLSAGVKIIFPAIIILSLFPHLESDSKTSLRLCDLFIHGVILAYLAINSLHIYYCIQILHIL